MSPAVCHEIHLGPQEMMELEYPGTVIAVLIGSTPYNAIAYKIRGNIVRYWNKLKVPASAWVCVYYH